MSKRYVVLAAAGLYCSALSGCTGSSTGGRVGSSDNAGSAGVGGSGGFGAGLRPFNAPNLRNLGAGQMLLTASGESLAQSGYDFPAATADAPAFVDGWQIRFEHLLVTFDKVTLSADPDTAPGDQSKTGAVVSQTNGPWAIDLHQVSDSDIPGKESDETAIPFATITQQNNGDKFTTDGTRYAVGFESVAADGNAINVNLGDEAIALYDTMIDSSCVVLYVGVATFKGQSCTPLPQNAEFGAIPTSVEFNLCFKSATKYLNCQNQDNTGKAVGAENFQRGVAFPSNSYVTGEVTFHTDHPFWDSTEHDSPAHFDQFAAQAVGDSALLPTVTLEQLQGVDYAAFSDAAGKALFARSCVDVSRFPSPAQAQLAFDAHGVPAAIGTDASTGLRDYYDFATYNQSTQGHWNGQDGLCAVVRQYPSPP
jgi:hypothetical protein